MCMTFRGATPRPAPRRPGQEDAPNFESSQYCITQMDIVFGYNTICPSESNTIFHLSNTIFDYLLSTTYNFERRHDIVLLRWTLDYNFINL